MIREIAEKEVHGNLYSIRFAGLLVMSAILFILNGILHVTQPVQKFIRPRPDTVHTVASRQHNRLEFCVRGTQVDRRQVINVVIGGNIDPTALNPNHPYKLPSGDDLGRFALPHADSIDWMFIIKMTFSLFAVIFTSDAICREREQGTLTLMCANPVPRSSILLGKYLGACGTLLIPLTVGIVSNLLVIYVMEGIVGAGSLDTQHWLRIGLLIIVSVVYISLFAMLGLLVSTISQRASSSLLILLLLWVFLIIILPNLAGIVAEYRLKTEGGYQLSQKQLQARRLAGMDQLQKQIDSGKLRVRTQAELERAAEPFFIRMMEIVNDAESEHRASIVAKRGYARRLAMVSPAALYQCLGEVIADTGFDRQQRFLKHVREYYRTYEDYVREKVGKIIPWCNWSFATNRMVDGRVLTITSPRAVQYKGDMSDFPYFTEREWSIIDSLRISLSSLAILLLWNILLFIVTHYVFMRRSLR